MRTIIFTSIFILFITMVNAQEIEATTAGGKKVMLNIGNYSWRYSNPQDGQKPCYTNYTADVTIDNKTNNDIYFHYAYTNKSTNHNIGGDVIKIQANSKRKIEGLYTKNQVGRDFYINNYSWKVSYEQFEIYSSTWSSYYLENVKGFDAGSFILQECELKTIEIFD